MKVRQFRQTQARHPSESVTVMNTPKSMVSQYNSLAILLLTKSSAGPRMGRLDCCRWCWVYLCTKRHKRKEEEASSSWDATDGKIRLCFSFIFTSVDNPDNPCFNRASKG